MQHILPILYLSIFSSNPTLCIISSLTLAKISYAFIYLIYDILVTPSFLTYIFVFGKNFFHCSFFFKSDIYFQKRGKKKIPVNLVAQRQTLSDNFWDFRYKYVHLKKNFFLQNWDILCMFVTFFSYLAGYCNCFPPCH